MLSRSWAVQHHYISMLWWDHHRLLAEQPVWEHVLKPELPWGPCKGLLGLPLFYHCLCRVGALWLWYYLLELELLRNQRSCSFSCPCWHQNLLWVLLHQRDFVLGNFNLGFCLVGSVEYVFACVCVCVCEREREREMENFFLVWFWFHMWGFKFCRGLIKACTVFKLWRHFIVGLGDCLVWIFFKLDKS